MGATAAEIEAILTLLAETPRRMAALSGGLEAAHLHARPDDVSWSANDVLAHLRACADVWGRSILAMIAEDHPTLRYVSPRTWLRKTDYPTQPFDVSLQTFARQRDDLLSMLRPLSTAGWSRGATFTGTVKGRDQTVFSYARRIVDHEAQHLDQIESVLSL